MAPTVLVGVHTDNQSRDSWSPHNVVRPPGPMWRHDLGANNAKQRQRPAFIYTKVKHQSLVHTMPPRPNSGESSTAADPQADVPVRTLRPRLPPPPPPKPRVKKKAPGPQAKGGRWTCKSAATVPDSPTPPESEEPQSGRASPNPREDGMIARPVEGQPWLSAACRPGGGTSRPSGVSLRP
ncbi:hypothetical protein FIBSPDRAFT_890791 [Athelia psychrophila]|uniref:Uncharacterized protein n=1 Tax=Athelia psychrophila TaxID=1759441 RepID=A0A166KK88_9AGAM|nr:hypothetical protein FIBSPDRAFT_890791 [Fibularhizoctonia sp. CBS 109695]